MRLSAGVFIVVLFASGNVLAFPDGAPWGSADPDAAENCHSCHFDGEVIEDSAAISLSYQDSKILSAEPADIYVQFENPKNKKAGFQVVATAGRFTSEWEDIEANGVQARSVSPRDNSSRPKLNGTEFMTDVVMWKLQWTPPEKPDGDVYFLIAVNESNDDQSALGDQIHYKMIRVRTPGDFWLLPPLR